MEKNQVETKCLKHLLLVPNQVFSVDDFGRCFPISHCKVPHIYCNAFCLVIICMVCKIDISLNISGCVRGVTNSNLGFTAY